MSIAEITAILGLALAVAAPLVGLHWRMVQKQVETLWSKHSRLAGALQALRLDVTRHASTHVRRDQVEESIRHAVLPMVEVQRQQAQTLRRIELLLAKMGQPPGGD